MKISYFLLKYFLFKDFIHTCASGESLRFIGEYASTVSLDKSDADPVLRQQLSHIFLGVFSN